MKKSLLVIFLCLLLLPVYGGNMAVDKVWDRILDKYESLCESCVQLKLKAEAGERVSKTEFSRLFSDLTRLRAELRDGSGSMTEDQRSRFESIRARYSALFGGTSAAAREVEQPKPSAPVARPKEIVPKKEVQTETAPQESVVRCLDSLPRLAVPRSELAVSYSYALAERVCEVDESQVVAPRRLYGSASYVMAVWPVLSYGACLSLYDKNTLWGGYAKFHGNFKSVAHSYVCDSDGNWDGGTIWPSGNTSVSYMQASAGIRKNFIPWFGVSVGAGYGRKVVLWEDLSGEWARVQDLSFSSVLVECGLIFDVGPIELQAGVSTIAFRTISLNLGLGLRF